jgi:hypothetical protein
MLCHHLLLVLQQQQQRQQQQQQQQQLSLNAQASYCALTFINKITS